MTELPKQKMSADKKTISLKIDAGIDEIYRLGKQNGWDVSEIARRAITEAFRKLEPQLKQRAS